MTEQLLVIGGSSPWNSHRLRETVGELIIVTDYCNWYPRVTSGATTVDQLANGIEEVSNRGYNLVGSRGYCYDAKKVAEIIRERNPNFNLITRNGGLRAKYIELYLKEKVSEDCSCFV